MDERQTGTRGKPLYLRVTELQRITMELVQELTDAYPQLNVTVETEPVLTMALPKDEELLRELMRELEDLKAFCIYYLPDTDAATPTEVPPAVAV